MPSFRSGNARNKFLKEYLAARDDFMQDVAQLLGRSVLMVDLSADGRGVDRITLAEPQTVQ